MKLKVVSIFLSGSLPGSYIYEGRLNIDTLESGMVYSAQLEVKQMRQTLFGAVVQDKSET